ncbi:MAG: hypothetical protein ACRDVW_11975 [Acidimicrobiales bacterium]
MNHVLWIGGPPCAGKTTIASRLARRHGLRLYSADTRTWVHRDRALAARNPAAMRWESMTTTERSERSSPAEMLEMSLHRQRGQMVIDDVEGLPSAPLVVAEGTPVPPWAVPGGIIERSHSVWLIPTIELQDRLLEGRVGTSDHIRLYRDLRAVIARDATEAGVAVIPVDGRPALDDAFEEIERRFAAVIAAGPVAGSAGQRRALLREANLAIVAQVRAYFARPWSRGQAETVTGRFACECGDTGCDQDLSLSIGDVASTPPMAPGHSA